MDEKLMKEFKEKDQRISKLMNELEIRGRENEKLKK